MSYNSLKFPQLESRDLITYVDAFPFESGSQSDGSISKRLIYTTGRHLSGRLNDIA